MILNSVDFPHPEGPTMVMNSPLEIERSSDFITSVEPNDLERLFHQETDNLEAQVDFNKRLLNNFHMVANKYPEVKQIISGELVK